MDLPKTLFMAPCAHTKSNLAMTFQQFPRFCPGEAMIEVDTVYIEKILK